MELVNFRVAGDFLGLVVQDQYVYLREHYDFAGYAIANGVAILDWLVHQDQSVPLGTPEKVSLIFRDMGYFHTRGPLAWKLRSVGFYTFLMSGCISESAASEQSSREGCDLLVLKFVKDGEFAIRGGNAVALLGNKT